MRHAEKTGDPNDPNLSDAGQARADRLARYVPDTFGMPDFIIATAPSRHSNRPFQTVEPLAKALSLTVDQGWADQDYGSLAEALLSEPRFTGKHIAVCWHHGNIPNMLHALGAPDGAYPDPWGRDVFDLVLVLEFAKPGRPVLRQVTEDF